MSAKASSSVIAARGTGGGVSGACVKGSGGVRWVGGRIGDQRGVGEDVSHGVDCAFNAGLEAGAEVEVAAGRRCLRATNCLEEAFGPQASVHLADADRASAWLLVESNQAIRHHGPVGRPWRRGVGKPVRSGRHLLLQRFGLASEAEQPVGQVDGVGAAWAGSTREPRGDRLDVVLCDAHRDRGREIGIGLEGPVHVADRGRVAKGRVLILKHLPHGAARLRTEVVGLADATAGAVGQGPDGRVESAGEDAGVEGSCLCLVVGGTGGGTPGKDLPLGVVDQGLEVALVPQVHLLREAQANVLGARDEPLASFATPLQRTPGGALSSRGAHEHRGIRPPGW